MASGVQNLDRLKRKIAQLPPVARERAAVALNKNADELVSAQKQLAEVHRRSGATVDSIHKEPGDTDLRVRVVAGGPSAYWAIYEEFGTVKMPAKPFFLPPYREMQQRFARRVKTAWRKAVQDIASGNSGAGNDA
ncbi:MAG TPA: HK97-gp10 family putative phage morphogenesis protein [Hyphomicrobiales bacterium]|nr:HK97-gp10 family putative phage morphogenesis protein [Hyphomicrobiales bacterium]